MSDTNVIGINDLGIISDPLTDMLKEGAQKLLSAALEAEISSVLSKYSDLKDSSGKQQVVRNGYLPERTVQTGIGDVSVQVPRIRDRSGNNVQFHSSLIPPYLRRSKTIEELLPVLYLKGISTGDFADALESLLGKKASGLSANTISRLKSTWKDEHEAWQRRDLSIKSYVYFWVDGVYIQARGDTDKQCLLVIVGADTLGKKEVVAIGDGYRESSQSWKEVLLDLKQRGLTVAPKLAIGDGAMGFWSALQEVYPQTQMQRCWVHKTMNLLNYFPKSMHAKVKDNIHNIWMAENKKDAKKAFDYFIKCYKDKYPKAAKCLDKDRDTLLTFFDFPAKHWLSIRSTNVIESVFATVKLRTARTRGCLSRNTGLIMVFKLIMSAQKRWKKLHGSHHCAEIIKGVSFMDGIKVDRNRNIAQERLINAA